MALTATSGTCILCGRDESREVIAFDREARRHLVLRCTACRHRFLDGWASHYDLGLYDYYGARVGMPKDALYDQLTTARLTGYLRPLKPEVEHATLLDVGCGEGQLVDAALAVGFDARGIDVTASAIEICRSFGLPCLMQDLFASELDRAQFHVVTLVETIEHVPEPLGMLRRVRDLLVPGGLVWLTTPNFASIGRRVLRDRWQPLSPEHLSYFDTRSLCELARRAGFKSVKVTSRTISAAAIRALILRPDPVDLREDHGAHVSAAFAAEQALRHRVDSSLPLRLGKAAVNRALSATQLGETLVAELR